MTAWRSTPSRISDTAPPRTRSVGGVSGLHLQVIATGADIDRLHTANADQVICADGGLDAALAAGLAADLVIGDFDSVTEESLTAAAATGTEIRRHPAAKDESDLELALAAAIARGAEHITVHLAAGGRLDHRLANLLVLASARWTTATVDACIGADDRVWVVRDGRTLPIDAGDPIALQPIGAPARVTTTGLAFELADETLDPTAARGIANRAGVDEPTIRVDEGVVLALGYPARAV